MRCLAVPHGAIIIRDMKSILKALFVFAGFVALLSSCLREDRDDCPPSGPPDAFDVRVLVKADADTRAEAPGRYDINSVRIWVFDAAGYFVTSWSGGAYTEGLEYRADLQLGSGDYRFVVWTNSHEPYYMLSHDDEECLTGTTHFDDLSLRLDPAHYDGRIIEDDIADIHHTVQEATVSPDAENVITLIVSPVTYRVNFTVEGLPVSTDDYHFEVAAHELSHDFSNSHSLLTGGAGKFTYRRTTGHATDGAVLRTSMIMVGLGHAPCDHIFTLSRTSLTRAAEQIFPASGEADLVQLIVDSYKSYHGGEEPDFASRFEFDVPLEFTGDGAEIKLGLKLGDWKYIENEL